MNLSSGTKGFIMVALSSFLWGTAYLFSQYILDFGLASKDIVFWKMLFASLTIVSYTFITDKGLLRINKKGLYLTAIMGLVCHALFNLFVFKTMEETTIATTVSLLYTAPIFVMIIARIFLKETLTLKNYIAALICLAGVLLTITGGNLGELYFNFRGILYGLSAGLAYAVMNVLSKTLVKEYKESTILAYTLMFATIFSLIFSNPLAVVKVNANIFVWIFLAVLGVVSTAGSYLLYTTGLKYGVESTRASVISAFEVPVSILGSFLVFGQKIVPWQLAGIILVLASVILLEQKSSEIVLVEGSEIIKKI